MADDKEYLVAPMAEDEEEEEEDVGEGEAGEVKLFQGETEQRDGAQRKGGEECCVDNEGCCSRNTNSISIQSGDIIPPSASRFPTIKHGRVYSKLFPLAHRAVKYVFYSEKTAIVPLLSLTALIVITAILGVLVFKVYPLTFNISIDSIQVPDHSSTKHWDAYQAALANQIYNDSSSKSTSDLESGSTTKSYSDDDLLGKNDFKSTDEFKSSGCCSAHRPQGTMHGGWVLELVYRIRAGREDRNLLRDDRIKYLHTIEDHIYQLSSYKSVCHFAYSNQVCDPVNSLLTYLYPQNKDDGSYVNPNLDPNWKEELTLYELSEKDREQLYWYAGGKVGGNLTVELLRAQVSE